MLLRLEEASTLLETLGEEVKGGLAFVYLEIMSQYLMSLRAIRDNLQLTANEVKFQFED
ncbi:MAG: hypothetical protein NZ992_05715 [Candidatus Korarchaeum sp.]|nr:hypothetical protein [Candidatus Korarchaeum sp.]MDW8035670.1 hypothetical protein [Candidatus Korarchaeum sp.]